MPTMQSPPGAETTIDGHPYRYFVGTGYLGLQGHPDVVAAACRATAAYGLGSATNRGGFGNTPPLLEVEAQAAALLAAEEAFCFSSGYVGGEILLTALGDTFDVILIDERSHSSAQDAARHSGKRCFAFPHRDVEAVRQSLKKNLRPGDRPLLLSDGVFAARGTMAPVAAYRTALAPYDGASICLDDCHALGVLGEHGRGSFEQAGLWDEGVNSGESSPRQYMTATLSKALGGYGGIVAGSAHFIEQIKSRSNHYLGASPPPVPAAAAAARAIELLMADPNLLVRLRDNTAHCKSGLRALGLAVDETPVPIVCLELGDAANMRRLQRELSARGVLIAYLPSYSGLGPEGALRIAVFATHTRPMIDELLARLGPLL